MESAQIAQVRRFNRIATERAGALNERFLGRTRPLGQARLLWEIGRDGASIRDLRARLGHDSGYLSRLLRALEADGLVVVLPDTTDGRVRRATLTPRGEHEWGELESRSEALAASVLEPLSERQERELVTAMEIVERLLTASLIGLAVESPRSPAGRWCLEHYYDELARRFDDGFDPATSSLPDPGEMARPTGLFLIARLRGEPVGCGGLILHAADPAEIKRMWVAPAVRGVGLGRRILAELERLARDSGASATRLDTNRNLTEAIAMYRSSGYEEIPDFNSEPYAHHWFEKQL
ncbi:MAG TPA: helix-turn-helix domain-containing GNAT family N-acetyltransferase [Gaiellaceae bacterium]|jgi:DNA-binding MarR family transcriptional regulator/GNAT superfamily N-acetyltransferase|nr:helix-turn-helix domain-containing GNAT family N-acetyltransferase [Gaiellaceae bacterium]